MADALLAEFNKLNDHLVELSGKKDFKACSEQYTTDCCYMITGKDFIIGREAVAKAYDDFAKIGGAAQLKINALEVIPHGDEWATERGSYTVTNKDGAQIETGKYVILRKKQDGKWLIHYDIFNSN